MAKIAINCIFFQPQGGGVKEYIYNLVNNIFVLDKDNEYVLYVLQDQIEYAKKNFPKDIKIKKVPFYSNSKWSVIKRSLFEQKFWEQEEKKEKFDIFHSPFFHSPKIKKAKVILTVHDLRFTKYPFTYDNKRLLFIRYKVKRSIHRSDHIISISEFTKSEIIKNYNINPDKITVIHNGVNNLKQYENLKGSFSPPPYLERSEFLLYVAHIEPRKNHKRLVKAFDLLRKKEEFKDLKLVLVGRKSNGGKSILDEIEKYENVIYLNFVELEFLCWLYANAKLFVFPSYYEGFGFPPVEAGTFGVVSVASNQSSIPEVCGDSAFYFNPFEVSDIANTIDEALSNTIDFNKKKALLEKNNNRFSWKKNALSTIELYSKIIKV